MCPNTYIWSEPHPITATVTSPKTLNITNTSHPLNIEEWELKYQSAVCTSVFTLVILGWNKSIWKPTVFVLKVVTTIAQNSHIGPKGTLEYCPITLSRIYLPF